MPRIARTLQHNRQTLVDRCSHGRKAAIDWRGSHQTMSFLDIAITHPPPNARLHNGAAFAPDDFLAWFVLAIIPRDYKSTNVIWLGTNVVSKRAATPVIVHS